MDKINCPKCNNEINDKECLESSISEFEDVETNENINGLFERYICSNCEHEFGVFALPKKTYYLSKESQ